MSGCSLILGRGKIFSFLYSIQTGSGGTQPPIQWIPGALSGGEGGHILLSS
jgi:hypothetical protein